MDLKHCTDWDAEFHLVRVEVPPLIHRRKFKYHPGSRRHPESIITRYPGRTITYVLAIGEPPDFLPGEVMTDLERYQGLCWIVCGVVVLFMWLTKRRD